LLLVKIFHSKLEMYSYSYSDLEEFDLLNDLRQVLLCNMTAVPSFSWLSFQLHSTYKLFIFDMQATGYYLCTVFILINKWF